MEVKTRCVHCKAKNYIKKGFRKTQNRGKIQKYQCLDCGKYFTNDEGFYRMRNSEKKITQAVDLFFSNLSSRKTRNFLKRHWEHNASHVTVLDWCRKYTLKVQKYIETLQPKLSGKLYADETMIDRKAKMRKHKKQVRPIACCTAAAGRKRKSKQVFLTNYLNHHHSLKYSKLLGDTMAKTAAKKDKSQPESKEEQIGFHKGALSTLAKERQEMSRILQIVEQLMQMHIGALKELGVDLQKEVQQETAKKKKKKPIEDILK